MSAKSYQSCFRRKSKEWFLEKVKINVGWYCGFATIAANLIISRVNFDGTELAKVKIEDQVKVKADGTR